MRLTTKIILAFSAIALVASAIFGAAFLIARNALYQRALTLTPKLARHTTEEMDAWIYERLAEMEAYGNSDELLRTTLDASNARFAAMTDRASYIRTIDQTWQAGANSQAIQAILSNPLSEEFRRRVAYRVQAPDPPQVTEFYVTNRYGTVAAASGRTSDYLQADEPWYQTAVAERHFWVGDVEYDVSSRTHSIDVIVPLRDAEGAFQGILKAVLNLAALRRKLDSIEQTLPFHGSSISVVDRQGFQIFSTVAEQERIQADIKLAAFGADLSAHPAVVQARRAAIGTTAHGQDLIAFARSPGYRDFRGLDWTLLLRIPRAAIVAPIDQPLRRLLAVEILVSLLAIAVAYGVVQQVIVRRLGALQEMARAFTTSAHEARSAETGQDEVGQLAQVFNEMLAGIRTRDKALASHATHLEGLVAERTADLTQANTRLRQLATVFENTADGAFIVDKDLRIIAVNAAFTRITGYTAEDALGQKPVLLQSGHHPPEFYQALWSDLHGAGHWRGEIFDRRKDGELFPAWMSISTVKDEAGQISHYIAIFSDITTLKKTEERLYYLVHHDPLTTLPNRLLFADRLAQSVQQGRREGWSVALLFIDLDGFKHINDSLGYLSGDRLLVAATTRLKSCVRAADTVARLGSDEFAILLPGLKDPEISGVVAQKIQKSLSTPFNVDGQEIFVRASIGISVFPLDGGDGETLIRYADMALYHAKEQGKDRYQFYQAELGRRAAERLHLEAGLHRALDQGELILYYQPQIDLRTGQVAGVEALIRWQPPGGGLIEPDQFIPMAEETGLIHVIGQWVLSEALTQLRAWQVQGLPPMRMAVNVSGVELDKGQTEEIVMEALRVTGVEARWLELEITEGTLIRQLQRTGALLERLKEMGVGIVIDDFGMGYSSLASLKHLPLDRLKIDHSFIRDIPGDRNNEAITRAVIAMSHSLDLEVIAEGVETEAQLQFLKANGCHTIQGYYLSPPQPAEAITAFINRCYSGHPTWPHGPVEQGPI